MRVAAALILAGALLPLLAVAAGALLGGAEAESAGGGALAARTVLVMLSDTALYVGGVLALSLLFALPAAWLVVHLEFAGRRLAVWLLLLPFALPPYITAYAADGLLRDLGWHPPGALVASVASALAVYPYVFLLTRMAFLRHNCHIQSAARLLGCSPAHTFWRVSLPLARPALAVGAALAAMETLNDIAVAEHFGLRTLGAGIYDIWLNRGDWAAGARLALLLAALVFGLVWIEEHARRRQAQYVLVCDKRFACDCARRVRGWRAALLWLVLLLPTVGGFWLPAGYLLWLAAEASAAQWRQPLADGLAGSLTLAGLTATGLLAAGILLASEKRANRRGAVMRHLARAARAIYALPGTVIAQGVILLAAALLALSGWSALAAGGIGALLLAYFARFLMIAGGALEAGMDKISPQLDAAARLAAHSGWGCFWRVHLPLLRPAIAAAAILVFLESIKELPMTLVLRPFNFDTLATVVYQYASDEALELAAPAALLLALLASAAVTLLFALEEKEEKGNST